MATYNTRVVESTRYEWLVPTPTNPAEYAKAYAGAERRAKELGVNTSFDDWLTLTGDEENLTLSFTVEKQVGR